MRSKADGFGLMCIRYDQPEGAPPPRKRYSAIKAARAGLGRARNRITASDVSPRFVEPPRGASVNGYHDELAFSDHAHRRVRQCSTKTICTMS
jgi:hypothetical protein